MNKPAGRPRPAGQIRQSQIITTFGPGAMVDLPEHSVLISGLDSWTSGGEEILEPRLVEKLKKLLDLNVLSLREPPPERDDPNLPPTSITAWQFPEWFITQDVDRSEARATRSRMLVHRKALTKSLFIDQDKKRHPVVPVRFVRACVAGHIGDIDWRAFVHNAPTECRRQLWIDERGTTGDLSEVWVRCECKLERPLKEAAGPNNPALGRCDGARPWLGIGWAEKGCNNFNRLLIRTASNAYFPQLMSVISLPDRDEKVREAVDSAWDFLEEVTNLDELKNERKKRKVQTLLEGVSDDEVMAELNARRGAGDAEPKSVRRAELETLTARQEEIGSDKPESVFYSRELPRESWDQPWMKDIERIVLVQRLREVTAEVGFTRFEPLSPDIEGELAVDVKRASLAREVSWLPAVENRGEGVFLQFSSAAIAAWLQRPEVQKQGKRIDAGFQRWLEEHPEQSERKPPGLPYLMLHSFSHQLITAVSLECGYPASSIRERVYAIKDVGYGVLLYTGSPDAEGTLGGLVEVGRRIHDHVRNALKLGELCSNDPVCAQHQPASAHERRFLHGAACHGCLLIAETSCEQHNDFLDRALVVPTIEGLGSEFFVAGIW